MRFSPSTKAFYPENIHYPNLPSDIVTVSDADFKVAQAARTAGHDIAYSEGHLQIVDKTITLDDAKARKLSEIAQKRFDKETGGVKYGGYSLYTDRASVAMLDSTLEKIRRNLINSIEWKCGDGQYLTISLSNADAIELAVLLHIQSCFSKEKQMTEDVQAIDDAAAVSAYNVEF